MKNVKAEVTYENKNIFITGILNCNSKVIFKNCIINYELESGGKVILGNSADIYFSNCFFKCNKKLKESTDSVFGASSSKCNGSLTFENCYFDNCQNLIKDTSLNNVTLRCSTIFFPISFMKPENDYNCQNYLIENNKIIIDNSFKEQERTVFDLDNAILKNNLFVGINNEDEQEEIEDNLESNMDL